VVVVAAIPEQHPQQQKSLHLLLNLEKKHKPLFLFI
jgi:hypothetical protein